MNLSGNKLVTASALLFAINMANADAPNLIEFSSGTAAKASEVNANFEGLKTYSVDLEDLIEAQAALITVLEEKATAADTARASLEEKVTTLEEESDDLQSQISALDGGDDYTIEVYGDDVLIGYTNEPKVSNDKQYMLLKTEYGMVALRSGSTGYDMREYDHLDDEQGSNSVYYLDDTCNNPVSLLETNSIGSSMFFTKVKGITDTSLIATSYNSIFLAVAGTEFSDEAANFYSKSEEGACNTYDFGEGSIYIPVVEMTEESHGLKFNYSSITLEGFVTN